MPNSQGFGPPQLSGGASFGGGELFPWLKMTGAPQPNMLAQPQPMGPAAGLPGAQPAPQTGMQAPGLAALLSRLMMGGK